ncbi:MAG: glycosyltransferase family 2 protein, partial [Lachnospiraceae bacterium]|nr:glycosyltransferase family 2 protein [Lachnospiraceae bacterium]
ISDGSKDATFQEIEKAAASNPHVKGARFSRNCGKEAAIFAGLHQATGNCAVVIDCDLQHPPEMIPKMFALWKEGYDVVEGIKSDRGEEGKLHKLFVGAFYGVMSKLMKINMNDTSDYKLLDRRVVDVLLELKESNTFFRALSFWAGFRSVSVPYEVQERTAGESKWSFFSLMKYALMNTTSFTTVPLQIVTFLGILSIAVSVIMGLQTLIRYFMGNAVEGFTTVILLVLIIGGFIMLSLGIIGHYIARIYEEVKGRPRYIIARETGKEEVKHE